MKIPLEEIGGKDAEYAFNAYRIAVNGARKEYQALSPIGKIDFHHREKFIDLEIGNEA